MRVEAREVLKVQGRCASGVRKGGGKVQLVGARGARKVCEWGEGGGQGGAVGGHARGTRSHPTCDHFRDGVLHLQPGVQLQERELLGILQEQVLHSARVGVPHLPSHTIRAPNSTCTHKV